MASMLPPRIIDVLPCLDLPDTVIGDVIEDAQASARDPSATLLDCPYNWCAPTDGFWRACRVLWRVIFRGERERLGKPQIATHEMRLAGIPGMQCGTALAG
jgi:hypothetical protein